MYIFDLLVEEQNLSFFSASKAEQQLEAVEHLTLSTPFPVKEAYQSDPIECEVNVRPVVVVCRQNYCPWRGAEQ